MLMEASNLHRAEDWAAALEAYRAFLAVEPGSAAGWSGLGGLLLMTGRLDEASDACRRALDLDGVFRNPIEDTIYAEKGGRGLTVVADGREALMGTLREGAGGVQAVEGAWSLNRGFVTLAEDYIKHDIYIMKIVSRFDPELQARFGPGYEKLRDVWKDEEAQG